MALKSEKKKLKVIDEIKVKLDLNELYKYHIIAGDNTVFDQAKKVVEEFQELMSEIKLKIIGDDKEKFIPNFQNFQNELLDLITASVNLMIICKVDKKTYEKHLKKLEYYIDKKYKIHTKFDVVEG